MKLPRIDGTSAFAPAMELLLAERRARMPRPLPRRERVSEALIGVFLVVAVSLMAKFFPESHRAVPVGPTIALGLAYALATRVRFHVGAGFIPPTQVVLVPMLFIVPEAWVPLVVAAALVAGRLPDIIRRKAPPDRMLSAVGDAAYSVAPAFVFAAAGVTDPDWGDTGIYVAAFAAQVAMDVLVSSVREWAALGIHPRVQVSVLTQVYMVDALLSPIGLLAAFVATDAPYRALLVLPLVGLLAILSQEREQHIESALELSNAYRGTALLLGDVLEDKDAYTAHHSHGVVSLSLAVADRLRLDPAARRRVEFGALLHDIGKIAVPGEILNKPGPLDADEWRVMKTHTIEGQQLLDRVGGVLGDVGRVVRSSHEHFDGSGYPDGLAGRDIPIESRIVACCDAFSAMTTTRSYRMAMTYHDAQEELVRCAGTQFDPAVVTALLAVLLREEQVAENPRALDFPSAAPAHSAT